MTKHHFPFEVAHIAEKLGMHVEIAAEKVIFFLCMCEFETSELLRVLRGTAHKKCYFQMNCSSTRILQAHRMT